MRGNSATHSCPRNVEFCTKLEHHVTQASLSDLDILFTVCPAPRNTKVRTASVGFGRIHTESVQLLQVSTCPVRGTDYFPFVFWHSGSLGSLDSRPLNQSHEATASSHKATAQYQGHRSWGHKLSLQQYPRENHYPITTLPREHIMVESSTLMQLVTHPL